MTQTKKRTQIANKSDHIHYAYSAYREQKERKGDPFQLPQKGINWRPIPNVGRDQGGNAGWRRLAPI